MVWSDCAFAQALLILSLIACSLRTRGAQCLSGRVLGSISRVCGFEPNRSHSVESLSKTLYPLLSTG